MRDLADSLSTYGEVMLRAIAEQWQAPSADAAGLAAAMLEPARLQGFLAGLPPEARAALAQVAASGGSIRGYLLTRLHGEVRRLGPRAIEREAPWRRPANGTERLWYAGLLFRRYARLGPYHGEVYYIPGDLLELLPPLQAPAVSGALAPVGRPEVVQDERDALALDLEALLARLRLQPLQAERLADLPAALMSPLGPRWRGPADPERLALLQRLALRTHLVVSRSGHFQVGAQARTWLQGPAYRRQLALFDAWQGDPHWNELWRVPSLRCEQTGWRNDPVVARAAVLEALRHCPEGWFSLGDLGSSLKATQPDFARPDGDYDSWYIRDAATGQYLQGFAHWDRVEGALVAHLVARSLHWLGAVAIGRPPGRAEGLAFRLTEWGRAFLRQAAPPVAPRPAPFVVRGDLYIVVPRTGSAYDRVRVERFARWEGREGDSDLFRMGPETAWAAFNAGIAARQIAAFLGRASGRSLPPEAAQALRAWGTGFGQVILRRTLLLQTANAETLRQLQSDPELGQRLGVAVSERAILVPEDELPQVLARLKALGWWPRLEGLPEP